MIPVHFLHVHIGMQHGMPLPGRSVIFLGLPSFVDLHPVMWIYSFEGSNEGFLICIEADLLENSCDLIFLSAYKAAHTLIRSPSFSTFRRICYSHRSPAIAPQHCELSVKIAPFGHPHAYEADADAPHAYPADVHIQP